MSTSGPHLRASETSVLPSAELIGRAYEAASEPSRWPVWFDALAASVGHRASALVAHGFGPARYVSLDTPGNGFDTLNPSGIFEKKTLSRRRT